MTKVRTEMREQLAEARGPAADEVPDAGAGRPLSAKRRVAVFLRSHRIRTHLFSGIEYEMTVFIVAPLTGWIIGVTVAAGILLVLFEVWLVVRLYRHTQSFPGNLAAAVADRDTSAEPATVV